MPPLTPADDRQSRPTRSAIEAVRPPDLSTAVLNVLWGDGEFVLSRAVRGEGLPSLLTLTPASSRPAAVTVERLESSYALRDELDPAWAALPLAVARYDGRPTLLLADEGGNARRRQAGVVRVLEETRWVVGGPRGAAARLGVKRTTLQSMMKRFGLPLPRDAARSGFHGYATRPRQEENWAAG